MAGAPRGADRPVSAPAPMPEPASGPHARGSLAGGGAHAQPADGRRLRILVVDDHDVVHWGFRLMLGQMSWVERCLSARTGAEALAVCRRYEPHVALVDLLLGAESGPEVCERLRAEAPAPRVLLMSGAGGISRRRRRLHLQGLARAGDRADGAGGRRRQGGLQGPRQPRRAHVDRPRGRDPRADRRRSHQPRDRARSVPLAAHRQGAHQHAVPQARRAQPRGRGPARTDLITRAPDNYR